MQAGGIRELKLAQQRPFASQICVFCNYFPKRLKFGLFRWFYYRCYMLIEPVALIVEIEIIAVVK
eukprot:6392976-Amphidinium_carterae.2